MQFHTLLFCRILTAELGNFRYICIVESKIGVGLSFSCYVLCVSAHSNGIAIVKHFAKRGRLVDIKRIRPMLNRCISIEDSKADVKSVAASAFLACHIEYLTNDGEVFLRFVNGADGQRTNLKGFAVYVFRLADIKNRRPNAAGSLTVFRKRDLAVNRCGARKHLLLVLSLLRRHFGCARGFSLILHLGACGIAAHFLNAILHRVVVIRGVKALDGVELDLQVDTVGIPYQLFHQARRIGTFDKVDARIAKRNVNIKHVARQTVLGTVEKSLGNDTTTIGLH